MFNTGSSSPKNTGLCTCDALNFGNQRRIKSKYHPGLTAAIQGWSRYCIIPDYDALAKEKEDEGD